MNTYEIVGSAWIEGTQRGYAVGIRTTTKKRIQLAHYYDNGTNIQIDKAYHQACNLADIINDRIDYCSNDFMISGRVLILFQK